MASASASSGTLSTLRMPSSRSGCSIGGGDSTAARSSIEPHGAPPQHLDRREPVHRQRGRRHRAPAAKPAISCAWPRGKSNRTMVQRWHGTIRRTRPSAARPISAGERAARIAWSRSCSIASRSAERRSRSSVALPLGDVGDHADRAHRPRRPGPRSGWPRPVPRPRCRPGLRKRKSWLSLAGLRAAERALGAGPGGGVEEVVHRPAQHGAVLVAEQLGHPLIDVGDDPAVVGHPDPFLRRVDQLLEALLALLQRLGALLEPALPRLEGRGVLERGADRAAEQPERLGVAVAEGGGRRATAP